MEQFGVRLPWQYSNAVPGAHHVLHTVLSYLVFQVACLADMHIETELAIFNILMMKQNYNKKTLVSAMLFHSQRRVSCC